METKFGQQTAPEYIELGKVYTNPAPTEPWEGRM